MTEFYIIATSFAAPFFSDTDTKWVEAESAREAIEKFREGYMHPFGLYSAVCYQDANAHSKGHKPLAKWLSNHELAKIRITEPLESYSYEGVKPGRFKVNDQWHTIEDPKGGQFVEIE